MSYELRQPAKDAQVIDAMRRLSGQYPRYGYRRVRIFLGREGMTMSPCRAERLWRKSKLQLPQKRPRKPAASRPRPLPPMAANQALQGALAGRAVLQMDQAAFAYQEVLRHVRECGEVANLDCRVGLSP